MQAKVSVIIPIVNSEAYVDELCDLLGRQTLRDVEAIFVDDGSTDGTLALLQEKAQADPRIRVLSQEHRGAGAARNKGLEAARGTYVMFLDADDTFEDDFIAEMHAAAEAHQADIAACRFRQEDYRSGRVLRRLGFDANRIRPNHAVSPAEVSDLFYSIAPHPYNKIWRRDWVTAQGLRFSETKAYNDNFFSYASLACARRIVTIDKELYHYRIYHNPSSISSNREENALDILSVCRELYDWLESSGVLGQYLDSFLCYWRRGVRNAAKIATGPVFAKAVADVLSNDEPWKSMSDRELQRKAGLQTVVASAGQRRAEWARRKSGGAHRDYEDQLVKRFETERANIQEVIRLLNQRGRKLKLSPGLATVGIWELRDRGLHGIIRDARRNLQSALDTPPANPRP